MKTHSLTLLSVLLLAAQALPTEPQQQAEFEYLQPSGDGWVTLGKPVIVATIPTTNVIVTGHFNRDQAKCNVTVTSQEKGVLLQVDCVRFSHEFSCVFVGDPTACLRHLNNEKVYWRQIGWRLRHLEHICEDSQTTLDTRVCSAKYPESNLKLLSSSLVSKTSVAEVMPTPTMWVKVKQPFQTKASKDKLQGLPSEAAKTKIHSTIQQVQTTETTTTTTIQQFKGKTITQTTPFYKQDTSPNQQVKVKTTTQTMPFQVQETTTQSIAETTTNRAQTQAATTMQPNYVNTLGIETKLPSQEAEQHQGQQEQQWDQQDQLQSTQQMDDLMLKSKMQLMVCE